MPRYINPKMELPLSHASTIAFLDKNRALGRAVRFTYVKADGTKADYVAVNPSKEAQEIIRLHAQLGRSRAPADPRKYRTLFIAGKGWRTFLIDGFRDMKCGTTVRNVSHYRFDAYSVGANVTA